MGTPCDPIRERFSELYENSIPAAARVDVKAHVDECARCRVEFASFVRAADALARLGRSAQSPAAPAYVASVMRAVDAAALEGASTEVAAGGVPAADRFRIVAVESRRSALARARIVRVASHLAAAVVGAACVWLLLPSNDADGSLANSDAKTASSPSVAPPPVSTSPPVQLVKHAAARVSSAAPGAVVVRDGREIAVDQHGLVLEPGDVLKTDAGRSFALALGDGAPVLCEATAMPLPEPRVIEKPVETVRYVYNSPLVNGPLVAVDIDQQLVDDVVKTTRTRFDRLKTVLETMTPFATAQSNEVASVAAPEAPAPPVTPTATSSTAAAPNAAAPTPESGLAVAVAASPVLVRREGDLVTLETRGPLNDVVPALLAKLDDSDPRVRSLVIQRLETIESDLKRDPEIARRLRQLPGAEPAEPKSKSVLGTVTGLFRDEKKTPVLDTPEKRWNAWWDANSGVVLQHETLGTW